MDGWVGLPEDEAGKLYKFRIRYSKTWTMVVEATCAEAAADCVSEDEIESYGVDSVEWDVEEVDVGVVADKTVNTQ